MTGTTGVSPVGDGSTGRTGVPPVGGGSTGTTGVSPVVMGPLSDGDVAYAYDAAGNRMTRTENCETITYTLGVGDRLASYGRAGAPRTPQSAEGAYTYDIAGNVTRIEYLLGTVPINPQ